MGLTIAADDARRHVLSSEPGRKAMAKADLPDVRNADIGDFRVLSGRCLDRARLALGWNLNELADALGKRDPRQVARWIAGTDRLHLDAVLAVPALHAQFVIALATIAEGIAVTTTISIQTRRTA